METLSFRHTNKGIISILQTKYPKMKQIFTIRKQIFVILVVFPHGNNNKEHIFKVRNQIFAISGIYITYKRWSS